jgi:hypothetical protein
MSFHRRHKIFAFFPAEKLLGVLRPGSCTNMDTQSPEYPSNTTLFACAKCAMPPLPGTALRRGRCRKCYDAWLKERPIGYGARCGGCGEQRRENLQYYEVGFDAPTGGRWAILCHNCTVSAERLSPQPRTIEGLHMRLGRDRRWRARRARATEVATNRRKATDRRIGVRDLFDATDLIEEWIEDEIQLQLEADYEVIEVTEAEILSEDVTMIHPLLDEQYI